MGFFSSSPEDNYVDIYVKFNPGATKAGAKACLSASKALGESNIIQREKFFDEQNPTATREQREIGLRMLANKDLEKLKKYRAQEDAWIDKNRRIETLFWEDVANGKIPKGTPSPRHIYERSLRDADDHPPTTPEEVSLQTSDNIDVVSKIKQLKELLDSGLITQDEFDSKKKEILSKL